MPGPSTQKRDVDYLITNEHSSIATADWIVTTYAQRNWVEVFYREAFMMVRIV